jgi:hypothetical protein
LLANAPDKETSKAYKPLQQTELPPWMKNPRLKKLPLKKLPLKTFG